MATKKSPVKKTAPRKKKVEGGPISVDALKHDDKRVNIPTADLAARLSERVEVPPLLYPRDPSLDPQLVWKGKDVQDSSDLSVPVVPIYIQEKIDPRIIVENLRETAKTPETEPELTLFNDFDGLEGTQMLEFYEHEGNWSNRMILGDSMIAMTSLAEKERLSGKVQTIFIDPPYGITFGSNWQFSTRKKEVRDGNVNELTRQPEQVKAFRDTWERGIHSYLSYMRDRLQVAHTLLTTTGSVFVQIGQENLHLIRNLLDETFGSENFCSVITFAKTSALGSALLPSSHDYIVWYARDKKLVKYRQLYVPRMERSELGTFSWMELLDGTSRRLERRELTGEIALPIGSRRFRAADITRMSSSEIGSYEFEFEGLGYRPSGARRWASNPDGMRRLVQCNRVLKQGATLAYKLFEDDFPYMALGSVWNDTILGTFSTKWYVVQTSTVAIARCILMTSDPGDLVLDPTCGSGTTAIAAEQWGRRWITIDTSRVALTLARTRLMSARFPFYLLSDSEEGHQREVETSGLPRTSSHFGRNIRNGFVCKSIPHVTLKSIAGNELITNDLNRDSAREIANQFVEKEVLIDQPFVDRRKVRVSGRFTVESLSPHRSISQDVNDLTDDFVSRIIGHLKSAGVQNTYKGERLRFDRLDLYPGAWINCEGEYSDADANIKRVAVVIGPEFGTVSADLIREAAIEATDGRGFDVLIVCGLAFDPLVGEQAKKFGRLIVLPTKINPDLTMPDGLLKNTGSGNLFTVFGEPDIDISRTVDGKVVVKVNGVDVYDPTTGVVRSGKVNDIACWFIDSNYDQKSFFVRHAHFTGGNEPYESLAKTLRTEIDLEAWSALYSNESQPFDVPTTGRIAVKVINHFGDEVMQIYDVK